MGEPERNSSIPAMPLENGEKCNGATTDERNNAEHVRKDSVTSINSGQQSKASSNNSPSLKPLETGESNIGTSSLVRKVSTSSTTKLASSASAPSLHTSSSIDLGDSSDPRTNGATEACPVKSSQVEGVSSPATSTPPSQQSHKSKKESIVYDDSQPTSQAQMVVALPQQQTVYYQIPQLPSVVTLPVEASQDAVPKNEGIVHQESNEQQQIQYTNQHQLTHLPIQTEDQIIGMVGAIPIIRLQGGGMHYVKEKKGRFNLLQDTPIIPNVVGVTPTTSTSSQMQSDVSQNNTAAPVPAVSSSRSQSPMPPAATGSTAQTVPQTFDGKSAPTVKRKGRFVVTNVKDPGSIAQIQTKPTAGAEGTTTTPTDNNATSSQQEQQQRQPQQQQQQQQQQQLQPPQHIQNQPSSIHQEQMSPLQTPLQNRPIPVMQQTFQQPNVSQIPLQPVMIRPVSTIQQTYELPQQYQQNYSEQVPINQYQQNIPPQTVQYSNVHSRSQQNFVQYIPPVQRAVYASNGPTHETIEPLSVAVPQEQQVFYSQQQQQLPKQQFAPRAGQVVQHQQINPSASFQQTISQSQYTATPPTTPGGSISSPKHSRPSANSSLPNAPIPKPPTPSNSDKSQQTKTANKKKAIAQGRSGKVPQSFDSNGTGSSIGLGRAFYLLDQMKIEVTDADQCIKTLQTDMKILRDKNKDLEAKNRELETKLREEQTLREKSEMRNMDLRKKLREAKDEIKTAKLIGKNSQEENEVTRKNSDAVGEKPNAQTIDGKETISSSAGKTSQPVKAVANPGTVIGASPKRHSSSSDGASTAGSSQSHNTISQSVSTPSTPKTKGANTNPSLNPPKIDLNLKEQSELKNGTDGASRLNRVRSFVKESEPRSRGSTMESSVMSKQIPEVSHKRVESMSTIATPPLMPPLRSNTNGSKASGHRHTQSLHEFDPLKSSVPVISFPTPLSLETLPIEPSTSESVSLPHDLRNTYVGQNSLVMPVSFGVAPTSVRTTNGAIQQNPSPMAGRQALVANDYYGLHEQQFMVVPQQQPIVFNQMTGRMQQAMVGGAYPTQQRSNTLQNHQYVGGSLQQQQTQQQPLQRHLHHQSYPHHHAQQHSAQQTYANPANPFDPFSS